MTTAQQPQAPNGAKYGIRRLEVGETTNPETDFVISIHNPEVAFMCDRPVGIGPYHWPHYRISLAPAPAAEGEQVQPPSVDLQAHELSELRKANEALLEQIKNAEHDSKLFQGLLLEKREHEVKLTAERDTLRQQLSDAKAGA